VRYILSEVLQRRLSSRGIQLLCPKFGRHLKVRDNMVSRVCNTSPKEPTLPKTAGSHCSFLRGTILRKEPDESFGEESKEIVEA
jgi:hypothetical protein